MKFLKQMNEGLEGRYASTEKIKRLKESYVTYSIVDLDTRDRFGNYDSVEMAKNKALRYVSLFHNTCAVIDSNDNVICGYRPNGTEIKAKSFGESLKKKSNSSTRRK